MNVTLTLTATDATELRALSTFLEMLTASSQGSAVQVTTMFGQPAEDVTPKKKSKAEADEVSTPVKKKKKKTPEPEPLEDEDDDEDDIEDEDDEDSSAEDESEDESEDDDEELDDDEDDVKPAPKKGPGRPAKVKDVEPVKEKKAKEPKQADLIEAFSNLAKVKGRGKAKSALEKLGVVSVRDIKEKDYGKAMIAFKV